MSRMAQEGLKLIPLGGLGEIGINCFVLEWKKEIVLIDCGIQFPDASYPGVELFAPDFEYLRNHKKKLLGIVVTHGHEDHIGAIPYLALERPLSVYATAFPRGLIEQKLGEFQKLKKIEFHEITPRKKFKVGPFKFDPIPVQHSIIESIGLAIETPEGVLVHTGDFKHDPSLDIENGEGFKPFEEWGRKGVELLLSDSTNAEKVGHTVSETDISESFDQIFAEQSTRLIIALFASNIRRIENLFRLAKKRNKKIALIGRSMHSYINLAHAQGSIDLPENVLISAENTDDYSDSDVIILATGSQAEPQSALVRITQDIHKEVEIKTGDTVILSSRFIPGNERNINAMINALFKKGAEVVYQSLAKIHVSGHGFQEELLMMLRAVRPKNFIPIHGEFRHLFNHAKLARQAGVKEKNVHLIEDGQIVELRDGKISLGERLELSPTPMVHGIPLEGDKTVFVDRAKFAKAGIVFAVLQRNKKTKALMVAPKIRDFGILYRRGEIQKEVLTEATKDLAAAYKKFRNRPDLEEALRTELRRFFKHRVSYKPTVICLVLES